MFQTYLVPVKPQPTNTLVLHFKSAAKLARELEAQFGRVRAGSTNLGDPSRVYVRKAQYDWRYVSSFHLSFRSDHSATDGIGAPSS